jgi:hypothetical protein
MGWAAKRAARHSCSLPFRAKSGEGLPQSKTLARGLMACVNAKHIEVLQPSGVLAECNVRVEESRNCLNLFST